MLGVLQSRTQKDMLYNLLVLAIYIVIMTVVLRFLWNNALVKYISILKPIDSLWHTFLLSVGVALFKC
jgi:ABC-type uncharacterized transport system permease subunit